MAFLLITLRNSVDLESTGEDTTGMGDTDANTGMSAGASAAIGVVSLVVVGGLAATGFVLHKRQMFTHRSLKEMLVNSIRHSTFVNDAYTSDEKDETDILVWKDDSPPI